MRNIILLCIFAFISTIIDAQKIRYFKSFDKTFELSNEQKIKSYEQFCPSDLYIVDSLIIVYESYCSDNFFYVYTKKDFKFLGSFGRKGRGPGEFSMLSFNSQYEKDKDGSIQLWIYEGGRLKAFKIDLEKAINSKSDEFIINKINIPPEGYPTSQLVILEKHSLMIGNSDMSEFSRYFIYNYNNGDFRWSKKIPPVPKETPVDNIGAVYFGRYKYSKEKDVTVSCLGYYPRIDFIDNNGEIYYSVEIDYNNPKPTFRDINHPDTPENFYYSDGIKITKNYIIISNYNTKYKNVRKGIVKKKMIQFFDWDGNPKYEFIINKIFKNFVFDDEAKILYIIDIDDEEYPIKYFDIKKYF